MTDQQTQIHLVRHAHSNYVPTDEVGRGLSARGQRDAELLASLFAADEIDIVLSSPYRRAIETVSPIARDAETDVVIAEGFRERRAAGPPGKPGHVEDFDHVMGQLWTDWTLSIEGGESNREAQRRGVDALEVVLDEHKGRSIVIGTHGNLLTLILNHFDRRYDFDFWKRLTMPDVYRMTISDSGVTTIERLECVARTFD